MAERHDTTVADKLKDIIEDLRRGKGKKSDVNEYEDEFQDSFEQLSEKGEDENPTSETATAHNDSETNISELEKQLKELQMERKKAYLRQEIEKKKEKVYGHCTNWLRKPQLDSNVPSLQVSPYTLFNLTQTKKHYKFCLSYGQNLLNNFNLLL